MHVYISYEPVFLSRNHVKPQTRVNDGLVSTVPTVSVVDGLRSPQPPASSNSVLAASELSTPFPHLTTSTEPNDDGTVAGRGRYDSWSVSWVVPCEGRRWFGPNKHCLYLKKKGGIITVRIDLGIAYLNDSYRSNTEGQTLCLQEEYVQSNSQEERGRTNHSNAHSCGFYVLIVSF